MNRKKIIAAGHLCVDMHPNMSATTDFHKQIAPGNLIEVGGAEFCSGGVVGNTGIGLYRLEQNVEVVGILGDDLLGKITLEILNSVSPSLTSGIVIKDDADTSYSIVLEAPGFDRCFLHCPGSNDTFLPTDINLESAAEATIFHFGYPTLMREFYINNGAGLMDMLRSVKEKGVVTSLDMSMPDPNSEAGRSDWITIFKNALPYVDIFLPSLDEICIMLGREIPTTDSGLRELADLLIDMGVAVVGIKLGSDGMYMRSSSDKERVALCSRAFTDIEAWTGAEYIAACRQTKFVSAKGAGDSTIAGFLAAILQDFTPKEAMLCATTVGACCVENPDATKGIKDWSQITNRMLLPEERLPVSIEIVNSTPVL